MRSGLGCSDIKQNFGTIASSQLCSIDDIVFLDTGHTGKETSFDSGPGVPGVKVELLNSTGTAILATTTTDLNGRYSFNNLVAGTYEVEFVSTTGFAFTTQGVGGNPEIDSSANTSVLDRTQLAFSSPTMPAAEAVRRIGTCMSTRSV